MKMLKAAVLAAAMFGASSANAAEMRPLVTLDMAKKMSEACEALATKEGWKIIVAVVDRGADLVLLHRQPDSFRISIDIAINKAKTSANIPFPTRAIEQLAFGADGKPPGLPGAAHIDGVVAFAGGLPIIIGGAQSGGIGVSGASADQDEQCAQAGLDAVADQLK
mgnify:FL=1